MMQAQQKYMAALVPRYIRSTRLSYLNLSSIIGAKIVQSAGRDPIVYDILMLPEVPFMRAKLRLGAEDMGGTELRQGKFAPAYALKNIEEVIIPEKENSPEAYAKAHFLKVFGLEN